MAVVLMQTPFSFQHSFQCCLQPKQSLISKCTLCRERQRQKNDFQQNKLGEYAETVQKLEQVQLDNQQLEDEHRRLQAELTKLQDVTPSAPTLSNGSSDSDSNHSTTGLKFTARTQRTIQMEPAHAVAYRKTEQAWFAKVNTTLHH